MRTRMRAVAWLVAGLLFVATGVAVGPTAEAYGGKPPWFGWKDRLEVLRQADAVPMAETRSVMHDHDGGITSRALTSLAAYDLREKHDPRAAWEALRLIFDNQNMDPSSDDYGMFPQKIYDNCWYGLYCYGLSVAPYTETTTGSSASFEQTGAVAPGSHVLSFEINSSLLYAVRGYHEVQILVNNKVAWEMDAVDIGDTWRNVRIDVGALIAGSSNVTVSFRMQEKRPVRQLPVTVHVDQVQLSNTSIDGTFVQPGAWSTSTSGEGVVATRVRNAPSVVNSTSFCLLLWAGILNSDDIQLFKPKQRDEIRRRVRAAAHYVIDDPNAVIGYTNARLIRDTSLILVGQALDDGVLYNSGRDYFQAWLDYTAKWGIREYGSPVYYAVDLSALMMGYGYASRPLTRLEYKRVLNLFWSDIAANFFPGRESLSGSHSRDYNFVGGHGPLEHYLYIEGWKKESTTDSFTTFDYQFIQSYGADVYHPTRAHYRLAMSPVKTVQAITDADRSLDRYNYVTPKWAMGSTSATMTNVLPGAGGPTPYDKAINVEMAGRAETPAISVVPEVAQRSPYGASYGQVPYHLPLFPVTAQHKGSLLAQLDLDPGWMRTSSISTNILFPLNADEILLNGAPVDVSHPIEIPATTSPTLVVRVNGACAAIRLLHADGIDGYDPHVALVVEPDGLDQNVGRLAAVQFDSAAETRPTSDHAFVSIYMQMGRCSDSSQAIAFGAAVAGAKSSFGVADGVASSSVVTLGGDVLKVGADAASRQILFRTVNSAPMAAPSILTVNGIDISRQPEWLPAGKW